MAADAPLETPSKGEPARRAAQRSNAQCRDDEPAGILIVQRRTGSRSRRSGRNVRRRLEELVHDLAGPSSSKTKPQGSQKDSPNGEDLGAAGKNTHRNLVWAAAGGNQFSGQKRATGLESGPQPEPDRAVFTGAKRF